MPTPDITERIPSLLSARKVSSDGQNSGTTYDVVLSGIGFRLAIDSQNPYQRESEQVQKQQIDTSSEAGEQTLTLAWTRSQTSWHLGAGAAYYEPGNRDETTPSRFRFKDSRGVNVWDQGTLSLLKAMDVASTAATSVRVIGARRNGEDVWFSLEGTTLYRHDSGGVTAIDTEASVSSDVSMANAGSVILMGGAFGVWSSDIASGGAITALCSQGLGTACHPYWVKGRIITTRGPALHEHALTGGAIDGTSEIFSHPDTGWKWSGVTEAPDAILAAGYSNGVSSIYALVLTEDTGGSVPKLGQPFQVAELPPGEEIRSIRSYLGRYLGIGTTAGLRVGVIGQNGQVQYGPLLLETDSPVTRLAARDSFLYAATGNSVIRVNLAESVDQGLRFPYAYDVEIPSGQTISSLAFAGVSDRVVVGADGVGTYEMSDDYVTSGWLESGEIRYGTTAPKAFRSIDVTCATDGASTVAVAGVVDDSILTLVTLSQGKSGLGISLGSLPSPLAQARYRLVLNSTGPDTPVVDAVAVKSVPVPAKQRLIEYPVQVVDKWRTSKNVACGRVGYASEVLAALEGLEDSGTIIVVNDLTRPEQFEGTIEKVSFVRVEPAHPGAATRNFGGIAKVLVRTA